MIDHLDYIKIPHHGSRYGLTQSLLEKFVPKVSVISVGKNNTYGHPNKEILDLLKQYKVENHRTDLEGDVVIETNGITWWVEK